MPKHLHAIADGINIHMRYKLPRNHSKGAGRVLECAFVTGLDVLTSDVYVRHFIEYRHNQRLSRVSGVLDALVGEIMGVWVKSVDAPYGVFGSPRYVATTVERYNRFESLRQDLSEIKQNLLACICLCYGFYYQKKSLFLADHYALVRRTVHELDEAIRLKTAFGRILLDLMEGSE